MKLLITGGCGFLGSNLAAYGLQQGYEIVVFDNLHRHGSKENLHWLKGQGTFDFILGDIRNSEEVSSAVNSIIPEAIFHLAGQTAMTISIADPRMDFETNALGTLNLLEAVRSKCPESAIIYSSTNKVYGDLKRYNYAETATRYECIDRPVGFDDDTPLEFHTPYGCSKGAAEQYVLDYARMYGLKTVVFRHSSMYGGRQFSTCDQGWVGWFCQQALDVQRGVLKGEFTISGNGKQVRDLLYSNDVARLYYAALEQIDAVCGMAVNVGGGMANSLSLLELFQMLEAMLGIRLDYRAMPARKSDQLVFVADNAKAGRLLGWKPCVSKEKGIMIRLVWLRYGR
jgi:CDP-paratose 2-epimerase